MTAKQYLGQLTRLNKMLSNKLSEIYQLRSLVSSIGVSFEEDKVQTSGSKDRVGDMVSKIVDLENEAKACCGFYIDLRRKIISQIDSMPKKTYYTVLFARYVEDKTFDVIADEMGYSWRQVLRIHSDALLEFERKYKKEFMSLNVILTK